MSLLRLATSVFGLSGVLLSACSGASDATSATAGIVVSINPDHRLAISPYIYGVNIAANIADLPKGLTLDRIGGNRWTAYNWENNASNAGSDWHYQNDGPMGDSKEAASAVTQLVSADQKNNMASIVTVQLQGLVAADYNGPVSTADPPDMSRFKKVVFDKQSISATPFTTKPPTNDPYVFMDEFVWSINQKFPGQNIFSSQPKSMPVFVSLDNEPDLWQHTHLEIQGKSIMRSDELIGRTIELAAALKKQFPDLVTFGPSLAGFMGIYSWFGEFSPTPNGNNWFTNRYLKSIRAASLARGTPLVDVFDIHWYPEATDGSGARITSLMSPTLNDDQVQAIVQSPRSLWDETYKEKSWIANDVIGQPITLIRRLQSRIDADYPGMKLAITEYNNGGGQHIAGTIAQADNLGIFGSHGLFAAALWPLAPKEPYSYAGFRAYRNFDGSDSHFGDVSLAALSSDPSKVSVYVSLDSRRAGRVVMVAINRSTEDQLTSIEGQTLTGAAHLFRMTAASAAKQSRIAPVAVGQQPVSGSSFRLTLPALSVTTIDIY